MVELHDLRPAAGSHRNAKRKGRGPGSGNGKTAGRGENGQKSRSGGSIRPGFEGGQMPLQRRIPKRGFTPHKRHIFQIVNVGELVRVEGKAVNAQTLKDAGLIRSTTGLIKLLAVGEVSQAYSVEAHKFSASAATKIEAAGGSITTLGPAVSEKPARTKAPAPKDEPAEAGEPEASSEPAVSDEPEVTEESEAADEPEAVDASEAVDELEAVDEPEAVNENDATDESAADAEMENDG